MLIFMHLLNNLSFLQISKPLRMGIQICFLKRHNALLPESKIAELSKLLNIPAPVLVTPRCITKQKDSGLQQIVEKQKVAIL